MGIRWTNFFPQNPILTETKTITNLNPKFYSFLIRHLFSRVFPHVPHLHPSRSELKWMGMKEWQILLSITSWFLCTRNSQSSPAFSYPPFNVSSMLSSWWFLFSWAQWVEFSDSIILVNSLYYPTEDEMFLLLQRSQKEAIAEEFKSPNYWVRQACMQVSALHWLALCSMLPAKWRGNHNAFFSLSQMSTEKLAILKSLFCSDLLRNLIYFIQWNDPTCRMVH